MYYKYKLQKKQVSTNNGQTWTDVSPLETRKGSAIGTYDTYSDCMSGTPTPYASQYLTFDIVSSGTIVLNTTSSAFTKTISYSLDDGHTWRNKTSSSGQSSGNTINVESGDKVLLCGKNSSYENNTFSASTASFNIKGNIMSLIGGHNFETATTITSMYTFYGLFERTKILSAENLILPSTTNRGCYMNMFYFSSLTTAPELPATTLDDWCYVGMFQGCTGLTTAPVLPATTLAIGCYSAMFYGCTGLTRAPELPATTLVDYCYGEMFLGCTNLNYIKCLATYISATNCTADWVKYITTSGTFVKASNVTWPTGMSGIPTGWTVQFIIN